jgi:hypothetical protein
MRKNHSFKGQDMSKKQNLDDLVLVATTRLDLLTSEQTTEITIHHNEDEAKAYIKEVMNYKETMGEHEDYRLVSGIIPQDRPVYFEISGAFWGEL